ncbi:MAG: hypothetical protein AAF235_08850, partial [Planctomycetota bacterium]
MQGSKFAGSKFAGARVGIAVCSMLAVCGHAQGQVLQSGAAPEPETRGQGATNARRVASDITTTNRDADRAAHVARFADFLMELDGRMQDVSAAAGQRLDLPTVHAIPTAGTPGTFAPSARRGLSAGGGDAVKNDPRTQRAVFNTPTRSFWQSIPVGGAHAFDQTTVRTDAAGNPIFVDTNGNNVQDPGEPFVFDDNVFPQNPIFIYY